MHRTMCYNNYVINYVIIFIPQALCWDMNKERILPLDFYGSK